MMGGEHNQSLESDSQKPLASIALKSMAFSIAFFQFCATRAFFSRVKVAKLLNLFRLKTFLKWMLNFPPFSSFDQTSGRASLGLPEFSYSMNSFITY